MTKRWRKLALTFGCVAWGALGLAAVAWAGLEEGRAAWRDGDYARAFEEFLPLATAGDVTLQNQVAAMYYTGQGVPQDYAKAAEWFRKAASAGSPEAQYCLGKLYYYGQGVPQNFEDAVKQLTEAAQGGKGGAQYLLATLQLYGKGIEANPVKAYFWTLLAAAAPAPPARGGAGFCAVWPGWGPGPPRCRRAGRAHSRGSSDASAMGCRSRLAPSVPMASSPKCERPFPVSPERAVLRG